MNAPPTGLHLAADRNDWTSSIISLLFLDLGNNLINLSGGPNDFV